MLLFYTKNAIITRKNIMGGYFCGFVIKYIKTLIEGVFLW
jgi:hypothetical protein